MTQVDRESREEQARSALISGTQTELRKRLNEDGIRSIFPKEIQVNIAAIEIANLYVESTESDSFAGMIVGCDSKGLKVFNIRKSDYHPHEQSRWESARVSSMHQRRHLGKMGIDVIVVADKMADQLFNDDKLTFVWGSRELNPSISQVGENKIGSSLTSV